MISVIIPTLNESDQIEGCLRQFLEKDTELLADITVVDGGSIDNTCELVKKYPEIILMNSESGRANAMNAGAKVAKGDILLFIHADCRLKPFSLKEIVSTLTNSTSIVAGAFDLKIDSPRLGLKIITLFANLRSRLTSIPYGDQAIFVRRDTFENIGGYPAIPIMEDVYLSRQLKKIGKVKFINDSKAIVLPRRWEKEGLWYTTLRNWTLVILFLLGVSPYKLKKYYTSYS